MSSGIYKITNKVNGKVYIGQSKNLENRKLEHFYNMKQRNQALYTAMRKYGIENFEFTVLQECDVELLDCLEVYYIGLYNSYLGGGYNMTTGGQGVSFKGNRVDGRSRGVYCINTGIAYCSVVEASKCCGLPTYRIDKICKSPSHRIASLGGKYDSTLEFCYLEDIDWLDNVRKSGQHGSPCIIFPSMQIVGNRSSAAKICHSTNRIGMPKEKLIEYLNQGKSHHLDNHFIALKDFLSIEPSTDITFEELCAKYYIPTDKKEHLAFINTKIDNLMQEITTTGVYAFTTNGDCVGIYTSLKECAQALGVSKPDITRSVQTKRCVGKYIFRCVNI